MDVQIVPVALRDRLGMEATAGLAALPDLEDGGLRKEIVSNLVAPGLRRLRKLPVFRLIHPPIFRIIHPPVPRPA